MNDLDKLKELKKQYKAFVVGADIPFVEDINELLTEHKIFNKTQTKWLENYKNQLNQLNKRMS